MPPSIDDMFRKIRNKDHLQRFFDSAFEKGDSRDLDILRGFLIDILFNNREKSILIAAGQAFVFTCLKLARNLETDCIYKEMFAYRRYIIGLGHRSRRYFDAFLEHPELLSLNPKLGDMNKIRRYMSAIRRRRKNFKKGEAKSPYFDQSRGAEWLKDIKEILWDDFYAAYLIAVSKFESFSEISDFFSRSFNGDSCFICTDNVEEGNKHYISKFQMPLCKLPPRHPDAAVLCYTCMISCAENKTTPLEEEKYQNLRWQRMLSNPSLR